ncbi:hypothetical protein [Nocardiopsis potens]|uniref:hypothetical protein n=1 Tax=Nocardiopsis potens TaxID=1246458 RepID=UPI000348B502|nr:hypothetical protein [Nocardiopsis potens]
MIDEFRAAFQELIDASVASDTHRFPDAVHRVYSGAHQVPAEERELALEALGTLLQGAHTGPGITADLCVVAGALVECGTMPGDAGTTIVRLLRTMGQGATVFLHAWNATGPGAPPDPDEVTAEAEQRVAARLGDTATTATICWWTIRRHALAAATMLGDHRVRAAVRGDAALSAELIAIANQLSGTLPEFDELRALLRMTGATSALVLDRATGRGFQVFFEGIGDNFQLHTLLADALVGPEGQGLPGHRPDPRWTAAFRDAEPDPQAGPVRGWWNLLALDGSWVWNDGVPADIPTHDGEHVLVLAEQPYPRSWNPGRRHPQVSGWLEVAHEVTGEELERWWRLAAPAQTPSGAFPRIAPADPEPAATPSAAAPGADPADQELLPWPGEESAVSEAAAPAPPEAPAAFPAPSAPQARADSEEPAPAAGEPFVGDPFEEPLPQPAGTAEDTGDAGPLWEPEQEQEQEPGEGWDAPAPAAEPPSAAEDAPPSDREAEPEPGPAPEEDPHGADPAEEDPADAPDDEAGGPRPDADRAPADEDAPGGADDGDRAEEPAGRPDRAPGIAPADDWQAYPPVTEQIPVLTPEMLSAYDAEREEREEPPRAPKMPPLPPGVSKNSAWGPRWR